MSSAKYAEIEEASSNADSDGGSSSAVSGYSSQGGSLDIETKCRLMCCCLICLIPLIQFGLALGKVAACRGEAQSDATTWDPIMPSRLMLQAPSLWDWGEWSLFTKTVRVYNNDTGTKIGHWSDENLLLVDQYGFLDEAGEMQLQAKEPWGFYFGKYYELWRCDGAGPEYIIDEDYWGEPWFSFGMDKIYDVKIWKGAELTKIATAKKKLDWGWWTFWSAEITATNGTVVATLDQEFAGWFQNTKWYINNHNPNMIPNSVVAFLAAVFDIDRRRAQQSSSASSSSSSGGSKR